MADNNSQYDVFISYSRKNKDAVSAIKGYLESQGFSCWMDLEGIESGSREFSEHIINAIDASSAMLFFLSAESQESEWALKEIDYATDEHKHVVIVRFNDDQMTKKFRFEFKRADIIDWRLPEQRGKLLRDMRSWSGRVEHPVSSSSVAAPPLVVCPVCGRKNRQEDTFKCRECGRDCLCLKHQEETTFLCVECAAALRMARMKLVGVLKTHGEVVREATHKVRVEEVEVPRKFLGGLFSMWTSS